MYHKDMPTRSHLDSEQTEDGSTREKLIVEFSNGSLQQLRDLAKFFDIDDDDPYKVLELGVGFLESVKQRQSKGTQKPGE